MLTKEPHKSMGNAAISPPEHRLATREISNDSEGPWFVGVWHCALDELSQGLLHIKELVYTLILFHFL